jgi:Fe-S cluster assembly ATP-binding protein
MNIIDFYKQYFYEKNNNELDKKDSLENNENIPEYSYILKHQEKILLVIIDICDLIDDLNINIEILDKNHVFEISGKRVLKDINLSIAEGETHVLLGPNGAGKSTLFLTILGFPQYDVVKGSIKFKGQDITGLTTAERVQMGIGVSFQSPPSIRGVSVRDLLKIVSNQDMDDDLNPRMKDLAEQLKFSDEFLDRDVNYGFSGGEVKRSEILQLLAQMPDFTMFDEPDSGVDIENVELLASEIGTLLDKDKPQGARKRSGLLITHLGYILNFVSADKAHVLMNGVISCSGNPTEILEDIRKNGFNGCVECAQCL